MADLGDLSGAVQALDQAKDYDTFTWYGVQLRIADPIAEYALLALARYHTVDLHDPVALAALADFFDALIHPEDVEKFHRANITQRVSSEDMVGLANALIEHLTGRPTSPPPASRSRRPKAGRSSRAGSSSVAPHLQAAIEAADLQPVGQASG